VASPGTVSDSALATWTAAAAAAPAFSGVAGFVGAAAGAGSELTIGGETRALGRKKMDAAEITSAPTNNPAPMSDHHLFRSWTDPSRVSLAPSMSQKFNVSEKESLHTGHIFMVVSDYKI
jgi:hypothetical protein